MEIAITPECSFSLPRSLSSCFCRKKIEVLYVRVRERERGGVVTIHVVALLALLTSFTTVCVL
jgi:hypothetical protein